MAVKTTEVRNVSTEFTDRVCNLLLVFLNGMKTQVAETDALAISITQLEKVIRKAARIGKATDLGKSIENFFKSQNLEKNFHSSQKEGTKGIVLEMVSTLKDILGELGDFDRGFTDHANSISSAKDLNEILAIKDEIITDALNMKRKTQSYKEELNTNQNMIQSISNQIEETKAAAVIDPLTKTLNRSAYNFTVSQVIQEIGKYEKPAILIVCDIDHFKNFNDTYGHKLGDKVICSVAETLQGCVRKSDDVFRYGGEEFVVLLKECPLSIGKKIAEKIRVTVEKDYLVFKEKKLTTTISLGLTTLAKGDSEEKFFERADQALYEAKESGRNCIKVKVS